MQTTEDAQLAEATLDVRVDWAPAYELLTSFIAYTQPSKHPLYELGPGWHDQVREWLPDDSLVRAQDLAGKATHELLFLFVRACPGNRDADSWLQWLAQVTPGAAYEALAHLAPDEGPRLPRDFPAWRDRVIQVLTVWNDGYFAEFDRGVIRALQREANNLQKRLPTAHPIQLIEEVTNGLLVEPGPEVQRVDLVPGFHQRPYNSDFLIARGFVIIFPCEAVPAPAEAMPSGLLRLTRALGDESRLRILRFVAQGQRTQAEVARFAGLSQPTVHHHLTLLRAAGLVRVQCSAPSMPGRYSLRPHALEQLSSQLGMYLEPGTEKGDRGA